MQQELIVNRESDLAYIQEVSKDSFWIYNLGLWYKALTVVKDILTMSDLEM